MVGIVWPCHSPQKIRTAYLDCTQSNLMQFLSRNLRLGGQMSFAIRVTDRILHASLFPRRLQVPRRDMHALRLEDLDDKEAGSSPIFENRHDIHVKAVFLAGIHRLMPT